MPTEPHIEIETESLDGVCVVRLKGRFGSGTDPEYVVAKMEEIKTRARNRVLVDLERLSSIGSMGIGFLVSLYTSVTKNIDGRFVLTGANRRVYDVLSLMRLDTVIPQAADVASGLGMLLG